MAEEQIGIGLPDITGLADASILSLEVTLPNHPQGLARPHFMDALGWEATQDFLSVRIVAAQEELAVPRDGGGEP